MKILLFGKNGQLGWELQRSLTPLGELVSLDSSCAELCGDLTDLAGIAETVRAVAPDVIVNAAAHTAVDKAESEPELARTINALAPGVLAQEAQRTNAWLVHYSTDYVFGGSGDQPWLETDATAPLSVYGATKLEGEQLIQQSGCRHLIFRTSWVYGARGGNFARTMLRLAQERDNLKVINDQIGAPTSAELLADATAHALRTAMLRPELSGLYHLAAGGETSWCGYAKVVLELARERGIFLKVGAGEIQPIPTVEYPTPAARPLNSRLDTHKFIRAFDLYLPRWQNHVQRMLDELTTKGLT